MLELPDEGSFEGLAESEFEIEWDEETGEVSWCFDTTLYAPDRVARMAAAFGDIARAVASTPAAPLPTGSDVFTDRVSTALPSPNGVIRQIRSWQQRVAKALVVAKQH